MNSLSDLHHYDGEYPRLLSVITINKNNASGLRRTLASLSSLRCHRLIEFIFVDGNSSDTSVQLASRFYSPEHLLCEPDSGIYAAMNKGLQISTGLWVLWLNSGDEFCGESWDELKEILLRSTATVLCGSADIIEERSGQMIQRRPGLASDLPWSMVNHSSTMIRREKVVSLGGYNESYRIASDRELLVRIYQSGEPIEYTDLCISRFWLGGISDKYLLLRAVENMRLDSELGLISRSSYRYGMLRHLIFHLIVRPSVVSLRNVLAKLGFQLPPLGSYAGPFGELRRDAFRYK